MKLRPQLRFPFRSPLRHLVAAGCLALVPTHALVAQAQGAPLLSISDPEGDDVGDGNLLPPREPVIEAGDLDLRSLQVFAERDGLRFELVLRNAVRDPAQVKSGLLGSEDLALFARRGFYAFNFDLYLDTDRVPGSGQTVALPGRKARFDPAHAWDKAIVLTPRPELMRRQLRDALADAAAEGSPGAPAADIDTSIDRSVFFVRDVRVRGRTVSFSVPTSFVDAQALTGASIVGMVTAGRLAIEADVGGLFGRASTRAVDRLPLGVALPEAGRPALGIGYRGDRAPATSIVDLLVPDGAQQRAQLTSGVLVGLNRDNRYGAALPAPTAAPVAAAPAPAGEGNWFSRALGALFGGGAAASSSATSSAMSSATSTAATAAPGAPAAAPVPSLQELFVPGGATVGGAPAPSRGVPPPAPAAAAATAPVAGPAPAAQAAPVVPAAPAAPAAAAAVTAPAAAAAPAARTAAPAAPAAPTAPATTAPRTARDAAFFEEQENRLRTLRRLRDSNLITEDEFQRKRKEILDAL
jgi:hypothetical protein